MSTDENSRVQLEVKELEENEKKLIDEYNQALSNLYLLPGHVLAVSSGLSGLLSSEPRFCWLFGSVVLVICIFLASLWFSVHFAHRQLVGLKEKTRELAIKRTNLYRITSSFGTGTQSSPILQKLSKFEPKNSELVFQARYCYIFLLLIIISGLFYSITLLVAAYYVLCDSKARPLEPVPDHVPFSPCVPCLRPYQDM